MLWSENQILWNSIPPFENTYLCDVLLSPEPRSRECSYRHRQIPLCHFLLLSLYAPQLYGTFVPTSLLSIDLPIFGLVTYLRSGGNLVLKLLAAFVRIV